MNEKKHNDCTHCKSLDQSIFCNVDDPSISMLNRFKTCNHYKKGQIIFHEANSPLGLYCVQSGHVKIFRAGSSGREQIVRFAKGGDVIGYRAFLAGELYTASACAMDDSDVCFIDKSGFKQLLAQNALLSQNLMRLLTHDLRESEAMLAGMAQKSVRSRIAEALLVLAQKFADQTPLGGQSTIRLKREELASYVGTSTETAIRLLSDFKSDGLIDINGRSIVILNVDGLQDEAQVFD